MSAKLINVEVEKCKECPASYWENDDDPMGGNGWLRCQILGRRIVQECWYKGIDPDCPLSDKDSEPTQG